MEADLGKNEDAGELCPSSAFERSSQGRRIGRMNEGQRVMEGGQNSPSFLTLSLDSPFLPGTGGTSSVGEDTGLALKRQVIQEVR